MLKRVLTVTALVLSTLSNGCFATAKEPPNKKPYRVEVVVFSKITPSAYNSETWPLIIRNSKLLSPDKQLQQLIKLNSINYQVIPPEFNQLNNIEKALRKNNYKILVHQSWQQTMPLNKKKAIPIQITGGQLYSKGGHLVNSTTENSSGGYVENELKGNIIISLNRYFNVDFNLMLNEPKKALPPLNNEDLLTINSANPNDSFQHFRLLQSRRTRSGELNYIDHPLFGVLFKISKIKSEQHVASTHELLSNH
jgi:hypothetical protein